MKRQRPPAEPARIAIVGLAFRFPGPPGEGFWKALCEGRDLVSTVDPSRWALETFYHPRKSEPGASYTIAGGSIGDISGFDAAFFGISPREAARMDPQQRLLLELAWEALEAGGIRPSSLRGSRCGVVIGFSGSDYSYRLADDPASLDAFSMTGITGSVAANRISYFLDLRGPSMAVDTACSSSLYALHQACQSVLAGESKVALAGAVNLHLHPMPYIAFSKAGMLSRRGLSSPFDEAGDGYVRSEGGAIVVLKPLADALDDGNRIYALVAATGINSDGRTGGLTVPSSEAQISLLREVYSRAGIDPADLDYVEAHGTGTAVGDPIEANALAQALARLRPAGSPLPIGSIKSNLGHLESAAGMAGLVKAILCLRHRALPPSIHFDSPNPRIPFAEWNLEVVTHTTALEAGKRLVIGVNSFGFGGANAHAVVESYAELRYEGTRDASAVPVIVSGRSDGALRAAAFAMSELIRERKDLSFYDIAYSAAFHRDWHEHRAIAYGADRESVAGALSAFARETDTPAGVATGRALSSPGGPVFVYSGNGSQWAGMGRRLAAESEDFRAAVERVSEQSLRHSDFSIATALESDQLETLLEATECAQPLLFAIQVGITDLLRGAGIAPAAVVGHSVGEIAAAWACGSLSLEEAVRVVYHRSAWQGTTRGMGAMTAVALGGDQITALLGALPAGARLAVAALNSPTSTTIAGPVPDLDALEAILAQRGVSHRRLKLDYAFHSAAMQGIEEGVMRSLAGMRGVRSRIPFYSTVTGEALPGEQLDRKYWWRNIREPVRFADAIQELIANGRSVFVEVGPQPVLRGYLSECLRRHSADGRAIPTMAPGADGAEDIRSAAFQVLFAGCPVDLSKHLPRKGRFVDLPHYPWQRQRHWYETSPEGCDRANRTIVHPLLGYRSSADELEWECQMDTARLPAMRDHRVGGEAVLPGAAFAEMALAAAAEWPGEADREIEELEIRFPLVLEEKRSKTVRFAVDSEDGRFVVRSRTRLGDSGWQLHAVGRLRKRAGEWPSVIRLDLPPRGKPLTALEHYRLAASAGLDYGPAFQAVDAVWRAGNEAIASLKPQPPAAEDAAPLLLRPAALDACLQLLLHPLLQESAHAGGIGFLPVAIGKLVLHAPRAEASYARLVVKRRGMRSAVADGGLYDASGAPIASLHEVRFHAVQLHHERDAAPVYLRGRLVALPDLAAPVAALPALERLVAACSGVLHAPERLGSRARYAGEVEPLLEALLAAFAREALAAGAPDTHAARLARIAQVLPEADAVRPEEIWRDLLGEYPDHAAEIIWLGGLGVRLAERLAAPQARVAPPPAAPEIGRAVNALVRAVLQTRNGGDRLRVLAALSSGESASRTPAALDPERCEFVPPAQARETGERFDLIVADEASLAAHGPEQSLAELSKLAMSGAVLVLAPLAASRAAALALELFDETARARRTLDEWRELLEKHGFSLEAVVGDAPAETSAPRILLARAVSPQAEAKPSPGRVIRWLLVADETGFSLEFAECVAGALEGQAQDVRLLRGDPSSPDSWRELLGIALNEGRAYGGIVHLAGLGGGLERQVGRCESLAGLVQACTELGIAPECWLVTARSHRDPGEAPLWGFARSAMNEHPALAVRLVDLDEPEHPVAMAQQLADSLLHPDMEDELVLRRGARLATRVQPESPHRGARKEPAAAGEERALVRLELPAPGQLKNLRWARRRLPAPAQDEVEIEVRAAGLNFRDVMLAMGQLTDEAVESGFAGPTLGMELSGVVISAGTAARGYAPGDEVIAFAPSSFSTRAITKASAVMRKPASWSFESAATVPVAFLTAYYALQHLAQLREGERVLIHGGAGGVGIAAIQIAQLAGAEIFATAGSDAKRDFLRLMGVGHVLDSRSLGFADAIVERTAGAGVDVVLNSLAGEAMRRTLQVLRPFGRFLELGKRDFYENSRIGLRPLRNNVAYFAIDADQLMCERPRLAQGIFDELTGLFAEGQLRPLPYRAFGAAEAVDAFRYMQQSKHIGKIVLGLDPAPVAQSAQAPGLRLRADATYLVTGGLRGFGLQAGRWLASKGARHLVLTGRSDAVRKEAGPVLAALAAEGVRVLTAKCDVTNRAELEGLLAQMRRSLPPLKGVVHAAAEIQDTLIRNMSRRQLDAVFAPKIAGALNLHELTRDLALDHFILFSSATTLFGNPGQANYVAANRFLEVLAESRRAAGLPATCVSWGPIKDTGYLARNPGVKDSLEGRMGASAMDSARALAALDQMLVNGASGLAVVRFDGGGVPRFLSQTQSPKYRPLRALFDGAARTAGEAEDVRRWVEELDEAELAARCMGIVKKELGEILRIAPESLEERRALHDLGLDSLMGVELMAAVEARFGVKIPIMALTEVGTIERLVKRIVRELRRSLEPSDGAAAQPSLEEHVRSLAAQHAPELAQGQLEEVAAELRARTAEGTQLGAK